MLATADEIAAIFGVTVHGVRNWEKAGCPIAVRGKPGGGGGRHQFETTEVHEWLLRRALDKHRRR